MPWSKTVAVARVVLYHSGLARCLAVSASHATTYMLHTTYTLVIFVFYMSNLIYKSKVYPKKCAWDIVFGIVVLIIGQTQTIVYKRAICTYSETCLFRSPLSQNFLILLNRCYITQVTLYVNDTFGDYFDGQFRQVAILIYSDLIRQVSLYNEQMLGWNDAFCCLHNWFLFYFLPPHLPSSPLPSNWKHPSSNLLS